MAKVFRAKEGVGRVAIQGHPGPASAVTMVEFITAGGGDSLTLEGEKSAKALGFLQELAPFLAPDYAETRFDTANELLIDEVVYLVDNWTFGVKMVVIEAGKKEIKAYQGWEGPNGEFHVLGGDLLAIPKGAPHREKALKLVELLLSQKTQRAMVTHLGWHPVRLDAYGEIPPEIEPYFDAIRKALGRARPRPTDPKWGLIERCLDRAFQQLVVRGDRLESLDEHRRCLREVPTVYINYEVQPGDTLAAIAERFETTEELIALANVMTGRSGLVPGQILQVPAQ